MGRKLRKTGYRWAIGFLALVATGGMATMALGSGGGNVEPGGNTPTGYKLAGPAIIGTLMLYNQISNPNSSGFLVTMEFEGTCKGKPVNFTGQYPTLKPLSEFTKNCETSVDDCVANGGYIETLMVPVDVNMYTQALSPANCTDPIDRYGQGPLLYVQAVPYFNYVQSSNRLVSDVVLLWLIPDTLK